METEEATLDQEAEVEAQATNHVAWASLIKTKHTQSPQKDHHKEEKRDLEKMRITMLSLLKIYTLSIKE